MFVSDTNIANRLFDLQQGELSMDEMMLQIQGFTDKPLISIIMPVYNTPSKWLKMAIESVCAQVYENWELCIVDDHSSDDIVKVILSEYSKTDSRIRIHFAEKNGGISVASNISLKMAKGKYVALFDHDDELTKDALFWMVKELNDHPGTDFIYSDECKIDDTEKRMLYDFIFKPDWSPEMLLNGAYTGHFTLYKKNLINKLGGFRSAYDFSQDYDSWLCGHQKKQKISVMSRESYIYGVRFMVRRQKVARILPVFLI